MRGAGCALSCAAFLLVASCAPQRDQLARSQRAFEQNRHELALSLLRDLEGELGHLTYRERATYAYLRGMTDYRIGYRPEARHWLALAEGYELGMPGTLPTDWRLRAAEALVEMGASVGAGGVRALWRTRKPGEDGHLDTSDDDASPP